MSKPGQPIKLAIILVLAGVVLWIGSNAIVNTRENQARLACALNLKSVAGALATYAEAVPGGIPTIDQLLEQGTLPASSSRCPRAGRNRSNYIVVSLPSADPREKDRVVAYEPLENHGSGAHVVFADGRILFVSRDRFGALGVQ